MSSRQTKKNVVKIAARLTREQWPRSDFGAENTPGQDKINGKSKTRKRKFITIAKISDRISGHEYAARNDAKSGALGVDLRLGFGICICRDWNLSVEIFDDISTSRRNSNGT